MSRRSYSRHIPDFRLMTHFAEHGNSPVHRSNPWTKSALLAVVILMAVLIDDPVLLLMLLASVLGLYALARLPLRLLIGWFTLPVFFVLTIAVLFIFTEPGDPLASTEVFGFRIAITDAGVMLLVTLLLRALSVVTFSLILFMTTKYSHMSYLVSRILPRPLANIFLLSYRFNFETSDELSDVVDAVHSRSGSLARGVAKQTKLFAGIFGLSFVHAFERAERIAKAMESRGFTGELPRVQRVPRPGPAGLVLLALALAALVLVAYSRYVEDLIGWW